MSATTPVNGFTTPTEDDPPSIEDAVGTAVNQIDGRVLAIYSTTGARDSANPTPTPGQTCYVSGTDEVYIRRGSAWVGLAPRFFYKTAAETVSASVTYQNDDHIAAPVEINSKYFFRLILHYTAPQTSGRMKTTWSVPSGTGVFATDFRAKARAETFAGTTSAATEVDLTSLVGGAGPYSLPYGYGGDTGAPLSLAEEGIITTVGTPGVFQLQWAQNEATSVTTVGAGILEIWKIG